MAAAGVTMLYKCPQARFPYERLREENGRRSRDEPELELLDTGVFDEDRYFDVFVELAKADVDDLLLRITVHNRGRASAPLDLLPQIWVPQHLELGAAASPLPAHRRAGGHRRRVPRLGRLGLPDRRDPLRRQASLALRQRRDVGRAPGGERGVAAGQRDRALGRLAGPHDLDRVR